MKAPKFKQSSQPSLSLSQLSQLSTEEFAEHARKLGTTPEKLSEIVSGGIMRKKEHADANKVESEERELFLKEYDVHLPQLRVFLLGLRVTREQLEKAEILLKEADEQFEQPGMSEIVAEKFWEAEEYRSRHLLLEKARNTSSIEALNAFDHEMKERIRVTNIPPHVDALRAIHDQLIKGFQSNNFGRKDFQGTPVHVESEGGLLFPKNPRPRRYNDGLEHY